MSSPSISENNSHHNYTILNISLKDTGFSVLVPRAVIKPEYLCLEKDNLVL